MKYCVLIMDGASGWALPERGDKTCLELAETPALDVLAKEGMVRLHIIPIFSVQVDTVEITTVGSGGATITSPQPVVDKREADTIALVSMDRIILIILV